ncbi:hypothetical protein BKA70DRAFT_1452840 [Coprinopsis sp. MPI-PUGE-AT-0042]|nr:hypothetical protein BKA70DRAFT_1452840 [Coprinopsis sp. MPI-PUGE-AT-0042]
MLLYSAGSLTHPEQITPPPPTLRRLYKMLLEGEFNREVYSLQNFSVPPGLADSPIPTYSNAWWLMDTPDPCSLDRAKLVEAWTKDCTVFDSHPSSLTIKLGLSDLSAKALREAYILAKQGLDAVDRDLSKAEGRIDRLASVLRRLDGT